MSQRPPPPPPSDGLDLGTMEVLKVPFSSPPNFSFERITSIRSYGKSTGNSSMDSILNSGENGPLVFIISHLDPFDIFNSFILVCGVFHDLTFFLLNAKSSFVSHWFSANATKLFFGGDFKHRKKYVCEDLFMKIVTFNEIKRIPEVFLSNTIDMLTYAVKRGFTRVVEQIIEEYHDPPSINIIENSLAFKRHSEKEYYGRKKLKCSFEGVYPPRIIYILLKQYYNSEKVYVPDIHSLLELLDADITRFVFENMLSSSSVRNGAPIRTILSSKGTESSLMKRGMFDLFVQTFEDYHFSLMDVFDNGQFFQNTDEDTILYIIRYCCETKSPKILSPSSNDQFMGFLLFNKKFKTLEYILSSQLKIRNSGGELKEEEEEQSTEETTTTTTFIIKTSALMFSYLSKKEKKLSLIESYLHQMKREMESEDRDGKYAIPRNSHISNINHEDSTFELVQKILETRVTVFSDGSKKKNAFKVTYPDLEWAIKPLLGGKTVSESVFISVMEMLRLMLPYVTDPGDTSYLYRQMVGNKRFSRFRDFLLMEYPTSKMFYESLWYIKDGRGLLEMLKKSFTTNTFLHDSLKYLLDASITYSCDEMASFFLDFSFELGEGPSKGGQEEEEGEEDEVLVTTKTFEVVLSLSPEVGSKIFSSLFDYLERLKKDNNNKNNNPIDDKSFLFDICLQSKNQNIIRRCISYCNELLDCRFGDFHIRRIISSYGILLNSIQSNNESSITLSNLWGNYTPDDYFIFRHTLHFAIENSFRSSQLLNRLINLPHWKDFYLLTLNDGYGRYFSKILPILRNIDFKDDAERKNFGKLKCHACKQKKIDVLREAFGKDYFYCASCTDLTNANAKGKGYRFCYNFKDYEKAMKLRYPGSVRIFCRHCSVNEGDSFPRKRVCFKCHKKT